MKQYIQLDVNLIKAKELKPSSVKILTVIMSYMPQAFPSISVICDHSGLCRETVFKHLKLLEERNVLLRHRRVGTSNFYELNRVLLSDKMRKRVRTAYEKFVIAFNKAFRQGGSKVLSHTGVRETQTQSINRKLKFNIRGKGEEKTVSFVDFMLRNPEIARPLAAF